MGGHVYLSFHRNYATFLLAEIIDMVPDRKSLTLITLPFAKAKQIVT